MSRRSPPRPIVAPPTSIAEGAALVRDHVVKLYDRQDGQGVDWQTVAGTLFRAAFDVLGELSPKQKQAFADRVHQRSYEAMTDDPGASKTDPVEGVSELANIAGLKSSEPGPGKMH